MQKQYVGIWRYLKKNRWWCFASILLAAELLLYACSNAEPNNAYQNYVAETRPVNSGLFSFVFVANTKAALISILYGSIPFGIGTLLNTYLTMNSLVSTAKMLLLTLCGRDLFFCILPHGLVEGTALIFTITLSCLLSKAITLALIRVVRRQPILLELKSDLYQIGAAVFLLLIPTLLLSTMIEAFVSPYVIRYLL